MTDYAHPELLAETEWLAERLGDPSIRIVDCDEFPAYQRAHIPGAVGLKVHHYLKEQGSSASGPGIGVHVMPAEEFEAVMSSHGIGNETTVVAYDSSGGLYAARLWWALDYYGHSACKLLNGGFRTWLEEGRAISMDQPHVERRPFKSRPGSDCLCTIDQVKSGTEDPNVVIWDVRSPAEHTGEDPRQNKRGGHIPGAVNLEWSDLLVSPPARSGLLLPADEIKEKLEAAGITPDKLVYTH